MTATAVARPSSPTRLLTRVARVISREASQFVLGIAVIALHVLDDNFVQPQPGTSPGDHLVGGLVPLAVLGLAAWAYPRLRGGRRGAMAVTLGVLGIVAGIEALHYTSKVGASGDDFTGLLAIPAGLGLLVLGTTTLWRTRRRGGSRARRYVRRALLGATGAAVALFVVAPLSGGTSWRISGERSCRRRGSVSTTSRSRS